MKLLATPLSPKLRGNRGLVEAFFCLLSHLEINAVLLRRVRNDGIAVYVHQARCRINLTQINATIKHDSFDDLLAIIPSLKLLTNMAQLDGRSCSGSHSCGNKFNCQSYLAKPYVATACCAYKDEDVDNAPRR